MWEKQLELLSDLSVFFYNMLTFVGENSQASGECESVSFHSDEELGREIGAQWRSIEPRLWLLDRLCVKGSMICIMMCATVAIVSTTSLYLMKWKPRSTN